MINRQHVWVGPEATSFEAPCEACLERRRGWEAEAPSIVEIDSALIAGTLRREADVGFMTCKHGHRIVVRRVGRAPWAPYVL
jgi:hypothetical protein